MSTFSEDGPCAFPGCSGKLHGCVQTHGTQWLCDVCGRGFQEDPVADKATQGDDVVGPCEDDQE